MKTNLDIIWPSCVQLCAIYDSENFNHHKTNIVLQM